VPKTAQETTVVSINDFDLTAMTPPSLNKTTAAADLIAQ
jgi:hypothetical protein